MKKKNLLFVFLLFYTFTLYVIADAFIAYSGILLDKIKVRTFSDFFVEDSTLGFKNKPNLKNYYMDWLDASGNYSTDKNGFRNNVSNYEDSKYFFVGDSFTFGSLSSREKTFFGLFGNYYNDDSISLAAGGYDISQYHLLVNDYIPKNNIKKTVFLCIFANDLTKPSTKDDLGNFYQKKGWNVYKRDIPFFMRFHYKRSLTYRIYQKAIMKFIVGSKTCKNDLGITLWEFRGVSKYYFTKDWYKRNEKEVESLIFDVKARNDISLVVLLFPSKESTYKNDYIKAFGNDESIKIEEEGFKRLGNIFLKNEIVSFDMTNIFRGNNKKELYYKLDPHWNELGNKIVFEYIRNTVMNEIDLDLKSNIHNTFTKKIFFKLNQF